MDLPQILDFITNSLSLVVTLLAGIGIIYVFLADPLRRWRFFGYLPTAVVALVDPLKERILVLQYDIRYYKHKLPLSLPQGGIYSQNLGQAVENVIQKTLGLEPNQYDIKLVHELGELDIQKKHTRIHKFQYGITGLTSRVLGKGYMGCLCICDMKVVQRYAKLGVGIKDMSFVTLDDFKHDQKLQDDDYDGKRIIYNKMHILINRYLKGKN